MWYEINFTKKIESIRILTTRGSSFAALSLEVKEKPIFHPTHLEFKRFKQTHTIPINLVESVVERTGDRYYISKNRFEETDSF